MRPATLRAPGRGFYVAAGLGVAALIFVGFAKTYYLKLAFGSPALPPLLHLHGLVMSLWFGLFILQARLVSAERVDLHRRLGILGSLLAVLMLGVGAKVAITAARLGHTPGPPPLVFLVVPMGDLFVFGTLVGLGLWYRRRPDVHKRLILLAGVGILAAAIARIPIHALETGGPLTYFGLTDLCVLACLGYDWARTRRLHPAFGWGALFIVLSHPLRLLIAGTGPWLRLARWMVG